jgi:fumarate reductase subunit C
MSKTLDVVAGTGLDQKTRKSHWPARLDVVQSASGLFLGLFMWGHMAFVSTILISKDAMWWVTRMFEGQFVFGSRYPGIVAAIVALVAIMFVLHGFLAMRKFPANFQEYRSFSGHWKMLRHEDTTLWWVQAVTGFALFFLASVHLYQMLVHPGDIGRSSQRIECGPAAGGRSIWCCCSLLSFTAASAFTGWRSNGDGSKATIPTGRASCSNGSSGASPYSF